MIPKSACFTNKRFPVIFKILFLVILGFNPLLSFAQKPVKQASNKVLLERKIYKITQRAKLEFIKDSIAIHSYNFKLKISKTKGNKIKVDQLLVSDSLLYKIFPGYMKLYDIDYKFLFKNRNQVTLIIPILIANVASISVSEFERQKGQPLVSLSSALETMKRSLTAIASDDNQLEENVVILSPNITEIYKIQ